MDFLGQMNQIEHDPNEPKIDRQNYGWLYRRALILVAAFWSSPSLALTASELIQANRQFGSGYVLGAIEYRVTVVDADNPDFYRIRNCIMSSNAKSGTLLDVVRRYIERHPETLPMPAIGAIIKATNEMCPTGQ